MFGFPYAVRMKMTKHDWRELTLLVTVAALIGIALSFLMPVWVSIPACLICGVVLGQATAMRQVHRDHEDDHDDLY